MSKSISEIRKEWKAIEAKRPGGGHGHQLEAIFEAADQRPAAEQELIQIIRVLNDSVKNYHTEMGHLLSHLYGTPEVAQ